MAPQLSLLDSRVLLYYNLVREEEAKTQSNWQKSVRRFARQNLQTCHEKKWQKPGMKKKRLLFFSCLGSKLSPKHVNQICPKPLSSLIIPLLALSKKILFFPRLHIFPHFLLLLLLFFVKSPTNGETVGLHPTTSTYCYMCFSSCLTSFSGSLTKNHFGRRRHRQ